MEHLNMASTIGLIVDAQWQANAALKCLEEVAISNGEMPVLANCTGPRRSIQDARRHLLAIVDIASRMELEIDELHLQREYLEEVTNANTQLKLELLQEKRRISMGYCEISSLVEKYRALEDQVTELKKAKRTLSNEIRQLRKRAPESTTVLPLHTTQSGRPSNSVSRRNFQETNLNVEPQSVGRSPLRRRRGSVIEFADDLWSVDHKSAAPLRRTADSLETALVEAGAESNGVVHVDSLPVEGKTSLGFDAATCLIVADECNELVSHIEKSMGTTNYHYQNSSEAVGVTAAEEDPDLDAVCAVCQDGEVYENDEIILCDQCDVAVHQSCYGVKRIPKDSWFCDPCSAGLNSRNLQCELCSYKGGAYKAVADRKDRWVHSICYLWMPEVYTTGAKYVHLNNVDKRRFKLRCSLCDRRGACVQCRYARCIVAAHPWCITINPRGFSHYCAEDSYYAYCPQHARFAAHAISNTKRSAAVVIYDGESGSRFEVDSSTSASIGGTDSTGVVADGMADLSKGEMDAEIADLFLSEDTLNDFQLDSNPSDALNDDFTQPLATKKMRLDESADQLFSNQMEIITI